MRSPSLKKRTFLRHKSLVRFCSRLGTLEYSQDLQAKKADPLDFKEAQKRKVKRKAKAVILLLNTQIHKFTNLRFPSLRMLFFFNAV
jgi:hypothetical protein